MEELNGWKVGEVIVDLQGNTGRIISIDEDFFPLRVRFNSKPEVSYYFDIEGKFHEERIEKVERRKTPRVYLRESVQVAHIDDLHIPAKPGSGIKHDEGKNRLDLLPIEALESIGEVFTFGSKKYGDRNWENGLDYSRLFGALLRHSFAFWKGEDLDPESGKPHLAHAGCCILMLLQHALRKTGTDNRSK